MRKLAAEERRILDRLLSVDFAGVEQIRRQASLIESVEPNCQCGCPSITPYPNRAAAPPVTGMSMLPTELMEVSRPNGVPRTVICFLDSDGYLSNLECVYYDDAIAEWPDADNCVIFIRDPDHYVVKAVLPSGAEIQPHGAQDPWVSFEFAHQGLIANTFSCWREEYDAEGRLLARTFTK